MKRAIFLATTICVLASCGVAIADDDEEDGFLKGKLKESLQEKAVEAASYVAKKALREVGFSEIADFLFGSDENEEVIDYEKLAQMAADKVEVLLTETQKKDWIGEIEGARSDFRDLATMDTSDPLSFDIYASHIRKLRTNMSKMKADEFIGLYVMNVQTLIGAHLTHHEVIHRGDAAAMTQDELRAADVDGCFDRAVHVLDDAIPHVAAYMHAQFPYIDAPQDEWVSWKMKRDFYVYLVVPPSGQREVAGGFTEEVPAALEFWIQHRPTTATVDAVPFPLNGDDQAARYRLEEYLVEAAISARFGKETVAISRQTDFGPFVSTKTYKSFAGAGDPAAVNASFVRDVLETLITTDAAWRGGPRPVTAAVKDGEDEFFIFARQEPTQTRGESAEQPFPYHHVEVNSEGTRVPYVMMNFNAGYIDGNSNAQKQVGWWTDSLEKIRKNVNDDVARASWFHAIHRDWVTARDEWKSRQ